MMAYFALVHALASHFAHKKICHTVDWAVFERACFNGDKANAPHNTDITI
jgi:hypothetical protein